MLRTERGPDAHFPLLRHIISRRPFDYDNFLPSITTRTRLAWQSHIDRINSLERAVNTNALREDSVFTTTGRYESVCAYLTVMERQAVTLGKDVELNFWRQRRGHHGATTEGKLDQERIKAWYK